MPFFYASSDRMDKDRAKSMTDEEKQKIIEALKALEGIKRGLLELLKK